MAPLSPNQMNGADDAGIRSGAPDLDAQTMAALSKEKAGYRSVIQRNGQKFKTTFTPIASAFDMALLPPGSMRYCRLGCTSTPGWTVHPYVNSRVISEFRT